MALVVDLSHSITAGMITYPGLPGPKVSDFLSREASRDHYEAGTEFHIGLIEMVANTGTYLDTPFHRFDDGYDLAELDLTRVAGARGLLVDSGPGEVGPDVLEGLELEGRAVLFHTGWDRHWGTDRYGESDHPFLNEAAAEKLAESSPALVGIDSVNIDDTTGNARPAHTALLRAGIPIVEHLTGLDRLAGVEFTFHAVPVAFHEVGTFPVRAYAVVD